MIVEEMMGDRVMHYSDKNLKIRQIETGLIYDDAVDVLPCRYTYEETNEPIEILDLEDSEILDILLGDEVDG